ASPTWIESSPRSVASSQADSERFRDRIACHGTQSCRENGLVAGHEEHPGAVGGDADPVSVVGPALGGFDDTVVDPGFVEFLPVGLAAGIDVDRRPAIPTIGVQPG